MPFSALTRTNGECGAQEIVIKQGKRKRQNDKWFRFHAATPLCTCLKMEPFVLLMLPHPILRHFRVKIGHFSLTHSVWECT